MSRLSPASSSLLPGDHRSVERLGDVLVRGHQVSQEQVKKALELKAMLEGRLGTNLLELGAIDENTLLTALGRLHGIRTAAGSAIRDAAPTVVQMIPAKLARRYQIVPFKLDGRTLWIAARDRVDAMIEDEIGLLTGCMVKSCIALEVRVFDALERFYRVANPVRYGALARRLDGARPAAPGLAESSPPPATPSTSGIAAPRPATVAPPAVGTQPPVAVSSAPASQQLRPSRPPAPRRPPTEPEIPSFIELDAEDEALLQRDSGDSEVSREMFPWKAEDDLDNGAAEEAAVAEGPGQIAVPAPAVAQVPAPPTASTAASAPLASTGPGAPAVPAPPAPAAPFQEVDTQEFRPLADSVPPEASIEERLHFASRAFQRVEIRDEIADVLLDFCAPYFRRRMLLFRRQDRIVGWRGEGEGIEEERVRAVALEGGEPSIFLGIGSSGFWLGPVPPLAANQALLDGLGGSRPQACLVLPITLAGKIVCYLYGDNLGDGVAKAPLAELRRLVAKAAVTFEVYILKNKIRMI